MDNKLLISKMIAVAYNDIQNANEREGHLERIINDLLAMDNYTDCEVCSEKGYAIRWLSEKWKIVCFDHLDYGIKYEKTENRQLANEQIEKTADAIKRVVMDGLDDTEDKEDEISIPAYDGYSVEMIKHTEINCYVMVEYNQKKKIPRQLKLGDGKQTYCKIDIDGKGVLTKWLIPENERSNDLTTLVNRYYWYVVNHCTGKEKVKDNEYCACCGNLNDQDFSWCSECVTKP